MGVNLALLEVLLSFWVGLVVGQLLIVGSYS
jgi:hypothetical protein